MTFWNKIIIGSVVIILAILLGFILNMYFTKPQTITNPVPVFLKGKDSIVVKHHYHFIKDTSKAEVRNDTAKAVFNTTKIFDKDTLRLETKVGYSLLDSAFNINQYFDFINTKEMRVDTIKITVPYEKIVYKDILFYEEPFFVFLVGLLSGLSIILFGGG